MANGGVAVNEYLASLNGLSLEQAELAISTSALTQEEKAQVLAAFEQSNISKELSAALATERINRELNSNVAAQELLTKSGIVTQEELEANSTITVTAAKLEEAVANGTLTASEAGVIAAAFGVELQNIGTAATFELLTKSIVKSTVAMAQFMATSPIGWIALISAGLYALYKTVGTLEQRTQELIDKGNEAKETISSIKSELDDNVSSVNNAKRRYAELAQEVDNLGQMNQSRGKLSNEDYEEFLDLSNKLAAVFPTLTKGYDDNGNAILDLSGNVDTIVGSLDNLLETERKLANQKILDEMPSLYSGWYAQLGEYRKDYENAQADFDKMALKANFATGDGALFSANGMMYDDSGETTLDHVILKMKDYKNTLEELGLEYEEISTDDEILIKAVGNVDSAFASALELARTNLDRTKKMFDGQSSSMAEYFSTWLSSEYLYNAIDSSDMQNVAKELLSNFDISSLPEDIDPSDWNAVQNYLRNGMLYALSEVGDNSDIKEAFSQVFSNPEITPEDKENYIQQLLDYFGEDTAIPFLLKPVIEDNDETKKDYENTINRFIGDVETDATKTAKEELEDAKANLEQIKQEMSDLNLSTDETKMGNLDFNNRAVIEWTKKNLEENKKVLQSWSDQAAEDWETFAKDWEGSISTVWGGEDDFSIDDIKFKIAFSPLLQTDDGAVVMDSDSVLDYIDEVFQKAYAKAAEDEKITDDELTREILNIDAEGTGFEYGGQLVKGLIAGAANAADEAGVQDVIKASWAGHYNGTDGAYNIAQERVAEAQEKLNKTYADGTQVADEYLREMGINTQEELKHFNDVTKEAKTATEAIEMYNKSLAGGNADERGFSSITNSVQNIKDKLASGLEEIGNAYKEIFTSDGFDIDAVDNDMLSSLKETLEAMEGFDSSSIEEFFNILTSSESQEEVQNAFDNIATQYIRLSGVISDLNKETRDAMTQQLEQLGVANAGEVFDELLEKQQAYAEVQSEFATANDEYAGSLERVINMSQAEIATLLGKSEASDIAKRALLELAYAQGTITDGTIDTEQDIEALIELAQAAGIATANITALQAVKDGNIKDTKAAEAIVKNAKEKIKAEMSGFKLDFDYKGTAKNAGKAGKDSGEEFAKEFKEAVDSILDGVLDKLGDRIDDLNDKMDDAVDALEKERDAAIESIEIEIDGIQDQIDAKNDYLDQLKKEKETREQNIALQKAQYELERAQNQRTILQYSQNKGMHYVADTKEVREKRDAVEDAKYNIQVSQIQNEIDLLEKEKDLLEDRKDEISDYYEKLIEDTKKYYENLIDNIEKTKSKYEELKNIASDAEYAALIEKFGLNEEALLSGSAEEFEKFKKIYVDAIAGVNEGNDGVLKALGELSGIDLTGANSSISETAKALTDTSTAASSTSTAMSDVETKASSTSDALGSVKSAVDNLNSEGQLSNLVSAIESVVELLEKVNSGLLGENGLQGAIAILDGLTISSVIDQFNALTDAINSASSAISGGGEPGGNSSSKVDAGVQNAVSPNVSKSSGGEDSGVTGAIKTLGEVSEEIIGTGGEDDAGTGVIGQFVELKNAAENVANAIGLEDATADDANGDPILIPVMRLMEKVGIEANQSMQNSFQATLGVVQQLISEIQKLIELMATASSMSVGGGISPHASGTVGKAFAKGYNGLPHFEKNALRSEYGQPELTVYPNGEYELTTKPTVSDLPKDTVIFNEDQTRRIFKNDQGFTGKAFANGTGSVMFGGKIRSLDEISDLQNKLAEVVKGNTIPAVKMLGNVAETAAGQISSYVSNRSTQNQEVHQTINVSLPNVNDSTAAITLMRDLESLGTKMLQKF